MGKFRSKTGCLTCRTRRVKCDEARPVCGQCGKKNRLCRYEAAGVNIKQYRPTERSASAGESSAPMRSEDDEEDREVTDEVDEHKVVRVADVLSQPADDVHHDVSLDARDVNVHNVRGLHSVHDVHDAHAASRPFGPFAAPGSPAAPLRLPFAPGPSASLVINSTTPTSSTPFFSPPRALKNSDNPIVLTAHEAILVRHFVDHLTRWLDCTDATRQLSLTIPMLVKHDAILLHAVLAFAAKHRKDVSTAEQAYGQCLTLLIDRLQSENVMHNDSFLCAIVILRFVEQLDVSITGMDSEKHLAGCSAILRASQRHTIDPSAPTLRQAAFWVYVRQCLYTSTVKQQPPNIDITLQLTPLPQSFSVNHPALELAQETSWANAMIWLCARVVHYCFDGPSGAESYDPAVRKALWNQLIDDVQRWGDEKPTSFDPIWTSAIGDGSPFPETLFTADWHGMAFGFYHFSRILLLTYHPNPKFAARNVGGILSDDDREILFHAKAICGACMSSPANVSNLITFCHTIFIWGPLMSDSAERSAVLELLASLEHTHSWPTVWITDALKDEWAV